LFTNEFQSKDYAVILILEVQKMGDFSIVKPMRCTSFSNLYYVVVALYMFRTIFWSFIRSLRLYIYLMLYVQSYTPDDG